MPKGIHKISKGTIGSLPCEVSLNKILIEAGDAHITRQVMSIYHHFCLAMKEFQRCDLNWKIKTTVMGMYRERTLEKVDRRNFSKVVDSHLRCCIAAQYNMALPKKG
jgi:hypothetical protein